MKAIASLLLAVAVASSAGCATIVSRSKWDVVVDTSPPGQAVAVTVRDAKKAVVGSGTTPFTINLKSGRGWFRRATYTLEVDGGSETTLKATFNGWYMGNLVFGGIIGFAIVDPLTGAMYRLPPTVTVDPGAAPAAPSGGMPYQ
jgi:hypothetical protein